MRKIRQKQNSKPGLERAQTCCPHMQGSVLSTAESDIVMFKTGDVCAHIYSTFDLKCENQLLVKVYTP